MKQKVLTAACTGILLAGCAGSDETPEAFVETLTETLSVPGFSTPESVLHEPTGDVYLVSNINGAPGDGADDNGFISRLSPDGEVLALKWIDGESEDVNLSAPKGMTVSGGLLYVTDVTSVQVFDVETGAQEATIAVDGATFLNDLAAGDDGTVYLTDTGVDAAFQPSGTDAVYRLEGDAFVQVIADVAMNRPNGIVLNGTTPMVVAFGSSEMFSIVDGARSDVFNLPAGSLDGIEAYDGGYYVSSWEAQSVYRVADGMAEAVVRDVNAPADIGYDNVRNRLLIPLFQDNEVWIVPLSAGH